MKKSETNTKNSIAVQLQTLEASILSLLNELSAADRITYMNGMISRMYGSPRKPVSSADRIQLVLAHRKGSTLSAEQQEKIRLLSELTNQLYDLENGSND